MQSKAKTVQQYVDELPDDRKKAISELRKVILKNLPKGFAEEMSYGMIGYVVPLSLYPKGYHCNPSLPLPYMNLGSQKNYIALHHMGVYADKKLLDWFVAEYPKHCKTKLDMGKGCIRFKKMDDIPYKLIGELAGKVTPKEWIAICEKTFKK
jgi:uncharacterized protein YdhG (YjbR/CyaY superfamily)